MSNSTTIVAKRQSDGSLVQVLPDGTTRPLAGDTDWARLEAMTDEEIHAAALADPDARPLTQEDLERMPLVPRVVTIRRALKLSQEDFAARYHIPVGTLRDWEQGRKEPDAAARAFLRVIATEPEMVRKALATHPVPRPAAN
jgi:putative transcriptional regulator